MQTLIKTSSIILTAFLLLATAQQSFAQEKLVQTFVEQNIIGDTYFGYSVSGAGDVNNDGYDDVIVGAPNYNSNTGRAYIYYGGSSMDSTVDVIMTGEGINNCFGLSVSGAGDVNNDGYDDVIVGAYYYNSYTGRAYIYYGGSSMDSMADVTMTGEGTNNGFGCSISSAGDVNDDGYDDVIIGAYMYDSFIGRAYIYYGGTSMDSTADVIMTGAGGSFGFSVSGAGDVNNDGYDDVVIGEPSYGGSVGRIHFYYGGNPMNDTADAMIVSESYYNCLGYSVSDAGDVNNDGYDDVIVGAYYSNSNTGRAYICYGGNLIINDTPDVTMTGGIGDSFGFSVSGAGDVNNDGYDDVIVGARYYNSCTGRAYIYYGGSSMDSTADVTMTGEGIDNNLGFSVSNAGDVNNDGYDDVIVGASYYDLIIGHAYIYYGGSSMDSTANVTMKGEGTNNYFGCSVSGGGDVNNDGYDDVIIGAPNYNSYTGRVYIYYGGNPMDLTADVIMTGEGTNNYFGCSVSGAGDVNNDGYDDVIVGAYYSNSSTGRAYIYYGGNSMDSIADVMMTGEEINNHFGCSVSGAGDANNDGYDDVIIGAYYSNSSTGRAYIYYGGNSMDSIADVIMTGEGTDNEFGYSVSGAGDVNNDGYNDVIVGAHYYSSCTGRAYIYYGGSSMDSTVDVIMTGEGTDNCFGGSVSDAGDVNNDGYDDVIIGAEGYSFSTGRAYIYYGGNPMNDTSDVTMTGKVTNNRFGYSVSGAGDVNNDGYDDVIVGAYYNNSQIDIYYGGSSMDSTADVTMTGEGINNWFGYSVSGAGDVNNDGYDDVIVGTVKYPVNGKANIYSDPGSPVSVKTTVSLNPGEFELLQNYPNPFNPTTTIEFKLEKDGPTKLRIFDILGREVATLVNKQMKAGILHQVQFDASQLPSGIYFSCLETRPTNGGQGGGNILTRKLLLIK
jgi:hypothetical protein